MRVNQELLAKLLGVSDLSEISTKRKEERPPQNPHGETTKKETTIASEPPTPNEKIEKCPVRRESGESLVAYLRRTGTALYLESILKDEPLATDEQILERTRNASRDMWEGSKCLMHGKYYNDPVCRRNRERIWAILENAV